MATGTVPAPIRALFDGRDLAAKVGVTAQLLVTADEWPRAALLSAGEVLFRDDVALLTVYAGSRTTAALRASGRAVLLVAAADALVRVLMTVEELADAEALGGRTTFRGRVETVEEDRVAYARVTGGIGFELDDPAGVVERWTRQIELLERAA